MIHIYPCLYVYNDGEAGVFVDGNSSNWHTVVDGISSCIGKHQYSVDKQTCALPYAI